MTNASSRDSSSTVCTANDPDPWSERYHVRFGFLVAIVCALGCTEERTREASTTSLEVAIESPVNLGSPNERLPDGARRMTVTVRALDDRGEVDTSVNGPVDVYLHYLGSLSPERGSLRGPAAVIDLADGVGTGQVDVAGAFGSTLLWAEDAGENGYVAGASDPVWLRDPYLSDVSRPEDETRSTALERTPLEGKQVSVSASEHGTTGALVVTGVYSQGYTVSDVDCSVDPCVAGDYGHLYIFTFGRPQAEDGTPLMVGQRVAEVSGSISEFNGLTEMNFPQTFLEGASPDASLLPDPVVLDPTWVRGQGASIELERVESGLVVVTEGIVCPLDDDFTMYGQWRLDVGHGCDGGTYSVISQATAPDFDPGAHVGQTLPSVVGTLRAVNIGSFHVWVLETRRPDDITL